MQGIIKTLFGDKYTLGAAGGGIVIAAAILHSPAAVFAGAVLPVCLLCAAAYLARR